jgi:hypothetical protein
VRVGKRREEEGRGGKRREEEGRGEISLVIHAQLASVRAGKRRDHPCNSRSTCQREGREEEGSSL